MPVRVVFDCMVFWQGAARAEGPAGACLQLLDHEAITLCISREILEEVREVLLRPRIQKKFSSLTPATIQAFLELVEQKGQVMETPAPAIANLRDPDDAPYLNLAIAAG